MIKKLTVKDVTDIDFDEIMKSCDSGFFIATIPLTDEKFLFIRNRILQQFEYDEVSIGKERLFYGWGYTGVDAIIEDTNRCLELCRYRNVSHLPINSLVKQINMAKTHIRTSDIEVLITEI